MRWKDQRRSQNIEDRRGAPARGGMALGGGGLLVLVVVAALLGIDPRTVLDSELVTGTPQSSAPRPAAEEEFAQFASVVLADTEQTWNAIFQAAGSQYQEPKLVLFSGAIQSACGHAGAAMGPFYCPGDKKLYLDLSFFDDLQNRFGATGDFARAYVIAHEVGHHIQTLTGISTDVRTKQRGLSKTGANELSVRQELQADCLAGIWAFHADQSRGLLERGDFSEAMGAAAAVGDDRLQRQSGGSVVPESFTHGTSTQRQHWFRVGFENGQFDLCDTFSAAKL